MTSRSKRGVSTIERYRLARRSRSFADPTTTVHLDGAKRTYVLRIDAQRSDWANTVRYFHGMGRAPRRSQTGIAFTAIVVILTLVTVLAVLTELV